MTSNGTQCILSNRMATVSNANERGFMDRESILAALQAVRGQIEKLKQAEKGLEKMLADSADTLSLFPNGDKRKRNPRGEAKRVISEILALVNKPLGLREIEARTAQMGKPIPSTSIRTTLSRAKETFELLEDGRWKLKDK